MKVYNILFDYEKRADGMSPDHIVYQRTEDENDNVLTGLSWSDNEEDYRVLTLPTFEEEFKACRTTLSNIQNSIKWFASKENISSFEFDPRKMLQEILTNAEKTLEEIKNA